MIFFPDCSMTGSSCCVMQVNERVAASLVVAQLLYLEGQKISDKDISLYINSPGGSVTAGHGDL